MTTSEKIAEFTLLLVPAIYILYAVGVDGATFVTVMFIAGFLINNHKD